MSEKAPLIARQNDLFRTTCGLPLSRQARAIPGKLMMTAGIAALPLPVQAELVMAVMEFDDFNETNDPHGEHDFGVITHEAAGRVFWKIDLYDTSLQFYSPEPTDPAQTIRVLTIMLAEEY